MVALLVLLAAALSPPSHAERCPGPYVTHASIHRVSADGKRIAVRVRAEMERPGIGAFQIWWGKGSGLIADGWWGRRATTVFEHRYRRPGTYRITVVAEGSSKGCKRLQKSEPARLRVRVPLSRRTDLSSP